MEKHIIVSNLINHIKIKEHTISYLTWLSTKTLLGHAHYRLQLGF